MNPGTRAFFKGIVQKDTVIPIDKKATTIRGLECHENVSRANIAMKDA